MLRNNWRYLKIFQLLDKEIFKKDLGPHTVSVPERIKAWIPGRTLVPVRETTWKRAARRKGNEKKLTSIKRLKYFQEEICVVLSHVCFFYRRRQTDSLSVSYSPLLYLFQLLTVSLSSDGFSCPLFLPFLAPLSCSPTFSPSLSSLAHFLCQCVCLLLRETQPRGAECWWLALAVFLFMEAENYTVTFPAFLLEISNRRSLSIQDRDPGGGETGCCYNHFLSHHFLQVD